jgi:hypothetical protein
MLLAKLLFEIAAILKFKIAAIEIFKGGYAPDGWIHRDNLQLSALSFFSDLSDGRRVMPIQIILPPSP